MDPHVRPRAASRECRMWPYVVARLGHIRRRRHERQIVAIVPRVWQLVDLEPLLAPGVAKDSHGMRQLDRVGTLFPMAVNRVQLKVMNRGLVHPPQAMRRRKRGRCQSKRSEEAVCLVNDAPHFVKWKDPVQSTVSRRQNLPSPHSTVIRSQPPTRSMTVEIAERVSLGRNYELLRLAYRFPPLSVRGFFET